MGGSLLFFWAERAIVFRAGVPFEPAGLSLAEESLRLQRTSRESGFGFPSGCHYLGFGDGKRCVESVLVP